MSRVVVVGSLSQDIVVKAPRRPGKGETLRGTEFGMFAGGKGNNQALAAARAGAQVAMIGRVGQDQFGDMLVSTLAQNKIDASAIVRDPEVGTGIANITVGGDGDNSIVIVQQANLRLCAQDIERAQDKIKGATVMLMQLEVPFAADIAAARCARKAGVLVALNPAPAPDDGKLPAELLENVDIIIPNQTEAEQLTGIAVKDKQSAEEAARALHARGPKIVIITMCDQGAFVLAGDVAEQVPTFPVDVVDTTAAGDAFCGGLAAALARGEDIAAAVRWGCAAGALACTKLGAEPSLPQQAEIEKLVRSKALV